MSDSQAYEAITVASDGVTVTKRFEADEFPVPAIAFNFESSRSEPVDVRLTDAVPESVAVEDLGFHPEYGSEHWTIDDDEIAFEREIEPGSEYTTVYGIRATGTDNVEQFLTEPTLERVDPPLADDESDLVGEGSDAVKDVISGDSDTVPGLDEEAGESEEDIDTLDLKEPAEDEDGEEAGPPVEVPSDGGSASDDEESAASAGGAPGDHDADTLVGAMAEELRSRQVRKEDVQLLRKAFEKADTKGSVAARVDKLQSDVSEVAAYADALEEFLDENGTGDELISDFRGDLQALQSDVDQFQSELDDVYETAAENDGQLSSLSSQVDTVQESVQTVEGTVDDVESSVDQVEDTVETVEGTVDDVETTVGDLEGTVTSLEGRLGNVESQLDALQENVSEDDDVDERIEEIYGEIEDLKAWREQLSSVIGGGND